MLFRYVTSMSRKQFDEYGEQMLKGWIEHWPEGQLLLYSEDPLPINHPRIELRDLWAIEGLKDFHEGLARFPIAHGKVGDAYNYRFNVAAFSKKAFAQMDAATGFRGYLFWVDADVMTYKGIPRVVLEEWMRGTFLAVMKRKQWHLCSSFVGWDCAHAKSDRWWAAYFDAYVSGRILTATQWDDAFILELCLDEARDIAEHIDKPGPHNVFDDVFMGLAHHAKGNLKKKLAA